MHFFLIGRDGTDAAAPERRQLAREAHLDGIAELRASGKILTAAALLDDAGQMTGSMLLLDFPSRKELDAWLETEAYVTGKVWESIEIAPCQVPEAFL